MFIQERWAFFRAWEIDQKYRFGLVRIEDPAPCPCCGYMTLSAANLGGYHICPVCGWEDEGWPDSLDQLEADTGATNRVSLKAARENFAETGSCDPEYRKYVRRPYRFEIPETGADPDAYFPLAQKLWQSRVTVN